MAQNWARFTTISCWYLFQIVAGNYDELIHKVKKDVVMFFYAPWCGHCKVSLRQTMMDYTRTMDGGMIKLQYMMWRMMICVVDFMVECIMHRLVDDIMDYRVMDFMMNYLKDLEYMMDYMMD